MDNLAVCLGLLRAESEAAVSKVLGQVPELRNSNNWHPIDGRETNFNVVTNQAATGGKALTELCTNMVDAVLLKHAYKQGVDPTGPSAPPSVIAGVRDLVRLKGVHSGILFEADSGSDREMQEFAEKNLVIGVTGGKPRKGESLCLTFVDNGEGQHPWAFEETFLSLSSGRKSAIPFVQGKYNMGSSGVLGYCGECWYKLILSRRFDGTGPWGWTLVRRRPGGGMPVAQYFKNPDGAIPSLPATTIHPLLRGDRKIDEKVHLDTGTVVKLYEYTMESGVSFRHIREALDQNLVSTILPFRLMDYRQTPDRKRGGRRALGIDERPIYGMEFQLLRSIAPARSHETEDGEAEYKAGVPQHLGNDSHPRLGTISLRAIVPAKQENGKHLPGWLASVTNRVFHAVNGQVQFKQTRGFLSNTCKLPALKDRVVIVVDASQLTEEAHNDVWKGDRETLRATSTGQLYQDRVAKLIRESDYLKDLQKRVAREETAGLADESQTELFQTLVQDDPSIAQLLPGGERVRLRGDVGRGPKKTRPWSGSYSPTFIELVGSEVKKNGAAMPLRGRRIVTFETDAVNDWLERPANRGQVSVSGEGSGKLAHTESLRNGRLRIGWEVADEDVQVGDEFTLRIALQDDAMPQAIATSVVLRVVAEERKRPPGPRPDPPKPPDLPGEDFDDTSGDARGLPQTQWLTRDGRSIGEKETERWPEDFHDQDGGTVKDLGEDQRVYCVNYDNAHFRRVLDSTRGEENRQVVIEQYRISMLVLMLGLDDAFRRIPAGEFRDQMEEQKDAIRRLAAQGAATVVMAINRTVSKIVNAGVVSDPDDA